MNLLVGGHPNGDFAVYETTYKERVHIWEGAHDHLIRVIISLDKFDHKYFATLDVCGVLKIWSSQNKPELLADIL